MCRCSHVIHAPVRYLCAGRQFHSRFHPRPHCHRHHHHHQVIALVAGMPLTDYAADVVVEAAAGLGQTGGHGEGRGLVLRPTGEGVELVSLRLLGY